MCAYHTKQQRLKISEKKTDRAERRNKQAIIILGTSIPSSQQIWELQTENQQDLEDVNNTIN